MNQQLTLEEAQLERVRQQIEEHRNQAQAYRVMAEREDIEAAEGMKTGKAMAEKSGKDAKEMTRLIRLAKRRGFITEPIKENQ